MELKLVVGGYNESMGAIAQVLAQGDACDYDNWQAGYNLPVYAILSDGTTYMFFRFDPNAEDRTVNLKVSRGTIGEGRSGYSIPQFQYPLDRNFRLPDRLGHGNRLPPPQSHGDEAKI
ncbi:hypothetical protein BDD12DRAFT_804133 [Trichophaea hybrida]|nr:hypothetical protein BDD12DRAFT_804133 [Trichophaea hybrida]